MDISTIAIISVASVVIFIFMIIYLMNVLHIYRYITTYYKKYDGLDLSKEKEILLKFTDEAMLVSRQEYDKIVNDFIKSYEEKGIPDDYGLFPDLKSPTMKVAKELVIGTGGGKAVILQLFHPFVTKGIELHSSIAFGIQKRFYGTFKYMFAMLFGTREQAVRAGKIIRSFHDKVKGELNDDFGGIYTYTSKFDASQKEALAWVGATLVETAIYEYEMMITRLSDQEKSQILNELRRVGVMFGLPLSENNISYDEFMRYFMAMLDSNILAHNHTTQDVLGMILTPPTFFHKPIFWFARWYSAVIMPEKFQEPTLGRKINFLDQIIFSFLIGGYRMFYNSTPECMRVENIYIRKERRHGINRGFIQNSLASLARMIGKTAIAILFPVPSKEKILKNKEAIEKRKEKYAKEKLERLKLNPYTSSSS